MALRALRVKNYNISNCNTSITISYFIGIPSRDGKTCVIVWVHCEMENIIHVE